MFKTRLGPKRPNMINKNGGQGWFKTHDLPTPPILQKEAFLAPRSSPARGCNLALTLLKRGCANSGGFGARWLKKKPCKTRVEWPFSGFFLIFVFFFTSQGDLLKMTIRDRWGAQEMTVGRGYAWRMSW